MLIAKLNTGQIVLVLKPAQSVLFSPYEHVLVSPVLSVRPNKWEPRWVINTRIAWYLELTFLGELNGCA